uniref:Endonuclease/exonuclease/phosphatase domain-containing protein n=1 Tax=Megaselia scalaris TaxID=36166 RepID=T1H4A8_MEGSC
MKLVLGDFNSKVGEEDIYKGTIGTDIYSELPQSVCLMFTHYNHVVIIRINKVLTLEVRLSSLC